MLDGIVAKLDAGERLGRDEGRWLLTDAPLLALGQLAQSVRFRLNPERVVTFAVDTNPNYTNVCVTDCQFCAFYRKPGDREAYTLTVEEVMAKLEPAVARGATTVLLQGGHNPALPLDYYVELGAASRACSPTSSPRPRSRRWPR
jgi:cyclic dehypoxanthinyl futalosine synthase